MQGREKYILSSDWKAPAEENIWENRTQT